MPSRSASSLVPNSAAETRKGTADLKRVTNGQAPDWSEFARGLFGCLAGRTLLHRRVGTDAA